MQEKKPQNKAGKSKAIPKSTILSCYGSKNVKVVDLTDVLTKFPEIFTITPTEPECRKEFTLDPNHAILAQPVYTQNKKTIVSGNNTESSARTKPVIPPSPFSTFRSGEDVNARGWYYIDEREKTQGPFTSVEMDGWFEQGYFFNELLIRFGTEGEFSKLIELLGKNVATTGGFNRGQGEKHYNKESHKDHHHKNQHQKDTPFMIGRSNLVSRDTKESSGPKPVLPQVFNQIHSPSSAELQSTAQQNQSQQKQKPESKRGSKRISVEENTEMMPKNIWENFVDKNKPADQKQNESPLENKNEATPPSTVENKKETNQLSNKEHEQDAEKPSKNKQGKKKKKQEHDAREEETKVKQEESNPKNEEQKVHAESVGPHGSNQVQQQKKPHKHHHQEVIEYHPKEVQTTDGNAQKGSQKDVSTSQKIVEDTKDSKGDQKHQTKKEASEPQKEEKTVQAETNDKQESVQLIQIKSKFEDIDSGDWIESGPKNTRQNNKRKGKNQKKGGLDVAETKIIHTQEDRQHGHKKQDYVLVFEPKASNPQSDKQTEKKTAEEGSKSKFLTWEESLSKKEEASKFQEFSNIQAEEEYPSLTESSKLTTKDIKKAAANKKTSQPSTNQTLTDEVSKESPTSKGSNQTDKLFPPLGTESPQKKKELMPVVASKKMVPVQLEKKGSDKKPATWDDLKKTSKLENKSEKTSKNAYDSDFPSL